FRFMINQRKLKREGDEFDVFLQHRLHQLGLEQRNLAGAAQVTESYRARPHSCFLGWLASSASNRQLQGQRGVEEVQVEALWKSPTKPGVFSRFPWPEKKERARRNRQEACNRLGR